jgi:hypothetical protein
MKLEEPAIVSPESTFGQEITADAEAILREKDISFITVPRFGLDMAFFVRHEKGTRVKLLEFKCYAAGRPGAVGFGTPKGLGPQVDILRNTISDLSLFEPLIRWAFVNALLETGQKRYALLDSGAAKRGAMADVRSGKQNNFRISTFAPYMTDWAAFLVALEQFLVT